ncbi:MAG: hypothetical protein MZU91_12360 [Desulfosudis oleivorans]|nr:hypothetical protein [Desulfosudis oleivorans]
MWLGVVQIGVVMALATLLTLDMLLPGGWIAGNQSLDTARTAGLHRAGAGAAVQRVQCTVRDRQCIPGAVRQRLALGRRGAVAWRCRWRSCNCRP